MTNWTHVITKRISHNPWIFGWVILCAIVLYFAYGCESKVMVDGQKITRDEVIMSAHNYETDYLTKRADLINQVSTIDAQHIRQGELTEIQLGELDRQDQQKKQLLEGVVTIIEKFAPADMASIVNVGLGALFPAGIGAFYLNGRRKDKVIAKNGENKSKQ